MKKYKIIIQYDGGNYHGWQVQKNAVTVQEILEKALCSLTGETIRVKGAGRTDAGVHALFYPVTFCSCMTIPADKLKFALNSRLPDDIVCLSSEECGTDFDAANSAKAKTYVYRIYNSEGANAFERRYSWHIKEPLDIERMRQAAAAFLEEHDFIGFCSTGFTVKTTVRTIYTLDITKNNQIIEISVTGNGFLYNMVRIMVGTLVFAGIGKINPSDMAAIITSGDRRRSGITAPPQGLFLKKVYY